jgi:hypothetical protein
VAERRAAREAATGSRGKYGGRSDGRQAAPFAAAAGRCSLTLESVATASADGGIGRASGRAAARLLAAPGAWPVHLVLAALVLPRAAFLGEAIFDGDVHLDWYPRTLAFARALRAGLPPLWDLSIGFGQPFLADPSGQVLYPTSWLALLLAPTVLYTVFALSHLVLAGTGATSLARSSGLRRVEATAAGAAFMLSGPVVSIVNNWPHFAGLTWMPWVVFGTHCVVRRPGRRSAALFAACLCLQVLAGSPDMLMLTALASAAWAVGCWRQSDLRRPWRILLWGVAGTALAVLLSAGQWIPTVDLAARAARRGLPITTAAQWSVPPAGLVRLLVPLDGTGRVAYAPPAQTALFDSLRHPFLVSIHLGVVTAALGVVALASRRRRRLLWALAGVAAFATVAALGAHAPLFDLLRRLVPGVANLRYPSKAMSVPALAGAILAGQGLAALRRRAPSRAAAGAGLAAFGGLALIGTAILFGPAWSLAIRWGLLLDRDGAPEDALPWAFRFGALGAVALLAAAVVWRHRTRGLPATAAAGVAACLAGSLLLSHYDLQSTAPASLLTFVPPVISAFDRSDRGRLYVYEYAFTAGIARSRLGHESPYAVAQPPAGIDPRPVAALALRLYPLPPVSGSWDVEGSYDLDLRGLQPLGLRSLVDRLRGLEGTSAHLSLMRLGAVRTIVALHRRGLEPYAPGPTYPSLFAEPILTFGVPGALPRARVVGRARALEGDAAVQAILAPGFDAAGEVVLSGPAAAAVAATARPGPAAVRVMELRGDRVRLDAELTEPGLVVLADAYDPGWRAWVDGRRSSVLIANVAFRAVAVPAGRHAIEMRYQPPSVALGLSLSAAGLVLLAAAGRPRRLTPAAASTSSAGSPPASASGAGPPSA